MSVKPFGAYGEGSPEGGGYLASGFSSRMRIDGNNAPTYFATTFYDFTTDIDQYRIYVTYCPYGGISPYPSEPLNPLYPQSGQLPNYGHRMFSIYDASYNYDNGHGGGVYDPSHWKAGFHVFAEQWDINSGYLPNRLWNFNYDEIEVSFPYVDYAMMYFSPINVNTGTMAQWGNGEYPPLLPPNTPGQEYVKPGSAIISPPAQGINRRENNSPGGAWNEAGVTSPTRGVANDTTWCREYFFMANFLFDPDGDIGGNQYNPQQGVHNLISPDTQPPFYHILTLKPRYSYGQYEDRGELRGLPMPHGVVMSLWIRDIPDTIGIAPYRERYISPIQNTYNSSSLSLIVKGGNFTSAHVQAF